MIIRSVLESGVRVVTEPMPEVRSAALGLWVGVGSRDEPAELAGSSHFLEHPLFGDHPLGRAILGTFETMTAVSPDSVREFHRAGYRARNIVVSAAGSVDHEQLEAWVSGLFPPDDRPPTPRHPLVPSTSRRLRLVSRDSEQGHLLLGGLGYPRQHP